MAATATSWLDDLTSLFTPTENAPFALTRAKVLGQQARTIRIDRQDEHLNDISVASRNVHGDNLGLLILRIGDLRTEDGTLDPLAKSVMHYLRLLLEPDHVLMREVRTSVELQHVWTEREAALSHVVLIGHGSEDSIRLMDCTLPVGGKDFAKMLEDATPTTKPKTFLSLSCLTGRQPFAKPFSEAAVCADYMAPFQSVHSAAASLFAQSFFANHLLNAMGTIAAYRRARLAVGAGVSYRHWRDGSLTPTESS